MKLLFSSLTIRAGLRPIRRRRRGSRRTHSSCGRGDSRGVRRADREGRFELGQDWEWNRQSVGAAMVCMGVSLGSVSGRKFEVLGSGPGCRFGSNGAIEGDEPATMRGGQAEQVQVGQVFRCNRCEVEASGIEKTDGVGPEKMAFEVDEFGEDGLNALHGQAGKGVAGPAHDAEAAVFSDGTCGPSRIAGFPGTRCELRGGIRGTSQ